MKHILRFRGCYCPSGRLSAIGGQPSAACMAPHPQSKRTTTNIGGLRGKPKAKSRWLMAIITTLLLTVGGKGAFAQDRRLTIPITGKVVDAITEMPLAGRDGGVGPSVWIVGTDIRLWVDTHGAFNFRGAHVAEGMLRVTFQGYEPTEMAFSLASRGPFTIRMHRQDTLIQLEEVDVFSTGFHRVPRERATGSFTHVDNSLLGRGVGSNVLDRLDGVTRGLVFNQSTMGAARFTNQPALSIRGRSTLFANAEPLVILDNFPFEGDVNSINPEDIESVTILQDAAAASIWGARAGNGVIVLTSKKGHFEQPLRISVRGDYGMGGKPDLQYAPTIPIPEYIELERSLFGQGAWNNRINQVHPYITPTIEALLAHRNGHIDSLEMEARLALYKTQDVRRDLSAHIYRPTALRKTAVNFQGGGGKHAYFFSAGYDRNVGNMKGNRADRITLQARNTFRMLGDRLLLDAAVMHSASTDVAFGQNVGYFQVLYDRIADNGGQPLSIGGGMNVSALRQSYIDTAGAGKLLDWAYRPLEESVLNQARTAGENHQVQAGLSYRIFPGLTASANYRYLGERMSVERITEAGSFFTRHEVNRFSGIDPTTGVVVSAMPGGGRLGRSAQRVLSHHFRGNVDFTKEWAGKHGLSVLGGWEVNRRVGLTETGADWWGYDPDTESHVPILPGNHRQYHTGTLSALPLTYGARQGTDNRNVLYFGNASYTLARRYTATFSARKDAANIFGADINRRGRPFWSAGLLWRIDRESFFRASSIPELALRVTHGYTGNVSNTSAYITSRINDLPDARTGRMYQVITTPPNPRLGWESVMTSNAALDFALFGGRLGGSVEHYRKTATDLLSTAPMNPSSGVPSLYGNWSSLRGNGWDVNLTGRNLGGDWRWQADAFFSHASEKVTEYKLKPANDRDYLASNLGNYPIEGKPMYAIFSLAWAGLDGDGLPLGYLDGGLSRDYTALYNNTALSDYVYHGRATPSMFGGLRNTVGFAGFDLSVNVTYQFGFHFRRPGVSYSLLFNPTNYPSAIFQSDYMARWQRPGDEASTHVPAAVYPAQAASDSFYGRSAVLVERGDHIRLQDARLGYRFGRLARYGIQSLTLHLYAANLGIIWRANRLGIDPQAVPDQQLVFPAQRNFAMGIDIKI